MVKVQLKPDPPPGRSWAGIDSVYSKMREWTDREILEQFELIKSDMIAFPDMGVEKTRSVHAVFIAEMTRRGIGQNKLEPNSYPVASPESGYDQPEI